MDARSYSLQLYALMKQVSNRFYFSFTVRPEAKAKTNAFKIQKVVPSTEEEARRILERMDAEAMQLDKGKEPRDIIVT